MGQSARFSLPWPELTDPADGPAAFEALATAVDDVVSAPALMGAVIGDGIVTADALNVTASSPAAMTVRVASGACIVRLASGRVRYLAAPAVTVLNIAAANGSNPRWDLVIAENPTTADDEPTVRVITGTPAASPALPATPAGATRLARVLVRAAATSVIGSDILDLRQPYSADPQSTGRLEMFWGAHTVPFGYLAADGSAVPAARYPRLAGLLGVPSTGTITLPNMADRFPAGAGGSLAVGATGGAAEVQLTADQMPQHTHTTPAHTHTGTTANGGEHSHTMIPAGAHGHTIGTLGTASGAPFGSNFAAPRFDGGGSPILIGTDGVGDHAHAINAAGDHLHVLNVHPGGAGSTGSTGGTAAHENRPPFRAVVFAIRV